MLIIILFYIINKFFLKKKELNEHYLTWFLPYYNPDLNNLSNFYNDNYNNLNYFKKKFIYKPIKFCSNKSDKVFINSLISNYISSSNINNIEIYISDNILDNLNKLLNNKINFLVSDYSTLIYANNILKMNIKNLRLVTNLYRFYYYFFTKKEYKVYSLMSIPPTFIIGIINYPNLFSLYFDKLMTDLGYDTKTDFKIKKYNNIEDLLNGLVKSECNMVMFMDVFPNRKLNVFLNSNIFDDIILIPFYINEESLFLKRNKHINIDYIDLNKLSVSYLPKNFANYIYNVNKPDFKIIYTNKILITNNLSNNNNTYDFIKFYFYNYKYINNLSNNIGYNLYKIDLSSSTDILEFHPGVSKFLYDKGYITTNDDPNCKYLVGTMACTDKNLKDNNLYNNIFTF